MTRDRSYRLAVVATLMITAGQPLTAGVITVNDSADGVTPGDGRCTIREAVDNANLAGGGDLTAGDCAPGDPGHDGIEIPPGVYALSVGAAGDDTNAGGDLDVLDSVSIVGAGVGATQIVAAAGDRLLDIAPNGAVVDVELTALSLIGGSLAFAGNGGGARVGSNATVIFSQGSVEQCVGDFGGGILNDGILLLEDVLLRDNRAAFGNDGGGLHSRGVVEIRVSTIQGNHADGNGGGVSGTLDTRLIDSELSLNSAAGDGGGLAVRGTTSIVAGTFAGNVADGAGGGLHHATGSMSITGALFDGNFATLAGGGIATEDSWVGEDLELQTNRSTGVGGAVSHAAGIAELRTTAIVQNEASQDGGGIHTHDSLEGEGLILRGNHAIDRGGAIFSAGRLQLALTTIDDNGTSGDGGGLYVEGDATLRGSAVTRNVAPGLGGGGYVDTTGVITLLNSTVSRNVAQDGGGLFVQGSVKAEFSTIARNEAPVAAGLWYGGLLEIKNSIIADNLGDDCGAAGGIASFGYNLDGDGSCGLFGPTDLPATAPLLGPLQLNSGPTESHALLAGSPAVDSADPDCADQSGAVIATDQRGVARPQDGDVNGSLICDRGSYERIAPAPVARPAPELRVGKVDPTAVDLELTWQVALCPSPGYHAVYGPLADVSSYVVAGGACGLDPSGADVWAGSASASIWFVVVGDDTAATESSWGLSSAGQRNGTTPSGQCGAFLRDNGPTCP